MIPFNYILLGKGEKMLKPNKKKIGKSRKNDRLINCFKEKFSR